MVEYDLFVRVKICLERMKAERCHPTNLNAFQYGILTGMNLAEGRLRTGLTEMSEPAMEILADPSLSLPETLDEANAYMPVGWFFDAGSFVRVSYRRSDSAEFYAEGLKMGFRYVYDLYAVFREMKNPTALTTGHLKFVRMALVNGL